MYLNDEYILILEDDVEMYKNLNSETDIEIPEDTDAFYLGFSTCGGSKVINLHDGPSLVKKISDKHIRIYNMLSAHAIIYKSKKYKEKVIQELTNLKGYHCDVIMSRLHPNYIIYGLHYTLFYQSVKWGNVQQTENCTKIDYTKCKQI